jgi:hypothetical protein
MKSMMLVYVQWGSGHIRRLTVDVVESGTRREYMVRSPCLLTFCCVIRLCDLGFGSDTVTDIRFRHEQLVNNLSR